MKLAAVLITGAWLLGAGAGCSSVRTDEGLVMLDVAVAADVPSFTTARFSVAGRPDVRTHEVTYDGKSGLRFGYYLPGPNGTLRITGQALSANCLFGSGTAEVQLQLGHVSSAVPLTINRAVEIDPACLSAPDASTDADGPVDAPRVDAPGRRAPGRRAPVGRRRRRDAAAGCLAPAARLPGGDQGLPRRHGLLHGAHLRDHVAGAGLLRQLRRQLQPTGRRRLLRPARVHQRRVLLAGDLSLFGNVVLRRAHLRHHQPGAGLLRQRRRPLRPARRRRLLRLSSLRQPDLPALDRPDDRRRIPR